LQSGGAGGQFGGVKTFRALALYALAVVALGLVLSLPVQAVCQHLGWFADKPWPKFFNRCATVAALVCLWPLLRALGMASWQGIGLQSPPALALARGAAGWVVAFAGTMLLGWTAVAAGNRVWDNNPTLDFLKPLATGCVVGIMEEVFFRGLLFGALRREWNTSAALWVSSVFYALLHFVGAPPTNWLGVLPAVVSLTAFGALLAWCYVRSGSLYLCIGVHAGCVAGLKWLGQISDGGAAGLEWLFGSGRFRLVNGVGGWPMLLVMWLVLIGLEKLLARIHARRD